MAFTTTILASTAKLAVVIDNPPAVSTFTKTACDVLELRIASQLAVQSVLGLKKVSYHHQSKS